MDFKALHQQQKPLLIGNVWDVNSTKVFEKLNFSAIATSSAAVAHILGYEDGEQLGFSELEYIVKRIISNTSLPVSVDIESGYGRDVSNVLENIERLFKLGVAGLNIEDSIMNNGRKLVAADEFAAKLKTIKSHLVKKEINMFLNIRTDTFIIGVPDLLNETKKRTKLYEDAGADGIFVPCIVNEDDISEIVKTTKLPVNVMCMPKLPDFKTLETLGVKRISMGNFLHDTIYREMEKITAKIIEQQSFKSLFLG